MSSGPIIGGASVVITPDTSRFRAQLQEGIDKAVREVRVPPITANIATAGGSAAGATVGTALAVDTTAAAASIEAAAASTAILNTELAATVGTAEAATTATVALAAAQAAVDRANLELLRSTAALATAQAQNAAESDVVAIALARQSAATSGLALAQERLALASAGLTAEQAALAGVGSAAQIASNGLLSASTRTNILQGSLIGLSRITPVAVFGLGAAGTAAIAAGLALKSAVNSAADFQTQLATLQAVSGATGAQMERISALAKELGADLTLPATSASDAADALTELVKAGLSIQDATDAAKGVLSLGTAADISAGSAAQIVATQLNAFSLSGTNAAHVADLLAGASIAAQGEIQDFGAAFQQVAAVANQVGLSIEVTTGALTELAKAGLRGADGGTSLRTALLRLAPTTKQAADFQRALNIHIDQTRTIGEQLPSLLDQYRRSLELLTPVQQQQALTQIFGQDAIRAASILIRDGAKGLDENTAAADRNGAALDLASAKTKGFNGAMAGLKSNAETLGITLGTIVLPALTDIANGLSTGIGAVNRFAEATKKLGTQEGFLGGALHAAGTALKEQTKLLLPGVGPTLVLKDAVNALAGAFQAEGVSAEQAAQASATAASVIARSVDESNRAISQLGINFSVGGVDESQQAQAKSGAPVPVTAAERAARKRLADAEKKIKDLDARRQAINDSLAPRRLRDPVLQAQLAGSLEAEKTADQAVEDYFQSRLDLADKGTARYTVILGQLTSAHQQTQSVINQINSEAKSAQSAQETAASRAQKDAEQARETALANREAALRLAAEAADNTGTAEQALLAFLQREATDARRTKAQQLASAKELATERQSSAEIAAAAAKADIDFRNSLLDLAIQRAEVLTPNDDSDNERAFNNKIRALEKQKQQAIKLGKKGREIVVTIESEILSTKSQLQALNNQSGNFSINDLFNESVKLLTDFGSNVSAAVTTGGGARQALAGAIVAQIPSDRTDSIGRLVAAKSDEQIQKAVDSNVLLQQILDVLKANGVNTSTFEGTLDASSIPGPAGFATAVHARKFANSGVGGN